MGNGNRIQYLKHEIEVQSGDLLDNSGKIALLDFPNYDNIGDSAIYIGELDYLKRMDIRPNYVADQRSTDWAAVDEQTRGGTILLTGGGNFGDIWPHFQDYRLEALRRFKGRRIVQCPQTVHFYSDASADVTARAIAEHGNFVLLVRDEKSLDFAQRKFDCTVRLCPDMAFAMEPLQRKVPTKGLLFHLRTDIEAAADHDTSGYMSNPHVVRQDWPKEPRSFKRGAHTIARLQSWATLSFDNEHGLRERRYARLARMRLKRGVEHLSQAQMVVTDRLHGHILCVLLGIPHCVIDNKYGKVSGYMNTWKTRSPIAHLAGSVDEAVQILREKNGLAI